MSYADLVIEISIPSGKMIVSDDLRLDGFDVERTMSLNSGKPGLDACATLFAKEINVAYAFVGNSSPTLTRQSNGSFQVISPSWKDDDPDFLPGETVAAEICTDHWATMITDYQNWLDHGGKDIAAANDEFGFDVFTVVDVTPGNYRWTIHSHSDLFDRDSPGRRTYARLERI